MARSSQRKRSPTSVSRGPTLSGRSGSAPPSMRRPPPSATRPRSRATATSTRASSTATAAVRSSTRPVDAPPSPPSSNSSRPANPLPPDPRQQLLSFSADTPWRRRKTQELLACDERERWSAGAGGGLGRGARGERGGDVLQGLAFGIHAQEQLHETGRDHQA